MKNEFILYKQSLKLKELGFNEECFAIYNTAQDLLYIKPRKLFGDIKAPLYQQAFRWFREKYNLECHVKSLYEQRENKGFYFGIDDYTNRDFYSKPYYSYEKAELECLKKLIEIVKNK